MAVKNVLMGIKWGICESKENGKGIKEKNR